MCEVKSDIEKLVMKQKNHPKSLSYTQIILNIE